VNLPPPLVGRYQHLLPAHVHALLARRRSGPRRHSLHPNDKTLCVSPSPKTHTSEIKNDEGWLGKTTPNEIIRKWEKKKKMGKRERV